MKKLIIILFVLVYNGAFAQSAIADLKFEEAEIAFKKITNRQKPKNERQVENLPITAAIRNWRFSG